MLKNSESENKQPESDTDSEDIHLDPYQLQQKKELKKKNLNNIQKVRKSTPNAMGASLSAVDIKSKNGYLFEKRANKIVETENGEPVVVQKKTIKQRPTSRHYTRYKYFEALPKFSSD